MRLNALLIGILECGLLAMGTFYLFSFCLKGISIYRVFHSGRRFDGLETFHKLDMFNKFEVGLWELKKDRPLS